MRHGVVAVPDLESGLESGGVDAIVIATPHADHAEAIRAVAGGRQARPREKPLTVRADDARDLATLADESRLRLATGLNHRFYPPVRDALALVGSGAIGRVERCPGRDRPPGHARVPQVVAHRGHPVRRRDLDGQRPARLRPDPPVPRRGRPGQGVRPPGRRTCPAGCEVEANALFRNHDNAVAELHASWALRDGLPDRRGPRLRGLSQGRDRPLAADRPPRRRPKARPPLLSLERVLDRIHRAPVHGCERSIVRELEVFASPTGAPSPPRANATGWDGCRVTEMIQAVYQSDRTGDEVHLKPLLVHLPSRTAVAGPFTRPRRFRR